MANWYLGTMGYGYKDWLGIFYPDHLRPRSYLPHYARVFNAVEMDTTYYGTPRRETVRRWRRQTPPGFKFCPKTPRKITHELKLVHADELMLEFVDTMLALQDRLGAFLIQLPPEFTSVSRPQLNDFLGNLPSGFQYAVEFRHRSWDTPETSRMMRDQGVCLVSSEYVIMPRRLHLTADFIYIRWLGRHGQFERKNRIQKNVHDSLEWWQEQLAGPASTASSIYGFFNNDFSGHSPATCNHFKALMGLEVASPEIPRQGTLF